MGLLTGGMAIFGSGFAGVCKARQTPSDVGWVEQREAHRMVVEEPDGFRCALPILHGFFCDRWHGWWLRERICRRLRSAADAIRCRMGSNAKPIAWWWKSPMGFAALYPSYMGFFVTGGMAGGFGSGFAGVCKARQTPSDVGWGAMRNPSHGGGKARWVSLRSTHPTWCFCDRWHGWLRERICRRLRSAVDAIRCRMGRATRNPSHGGAGT
jgi:hypothetical protein